MFGQLIPMIFEFLSEKMNVIGSALKFLDKYLPGGIGGGVGNELPWALNPFSSAMYDTDTGFPSGEV